MEIDAFALGPLQANGYLLRDPAAGASVLVDPGGDADILLAAIAAGGLDLDAIWLTHAHFDHVGALAEVLEHHDAPVFLHPADLPLLRRAAAAAAAWGVSQRQSHVEPRPLAHGRILTAGSLHARVLYTPGHAPGHCCFYLAEPRVLLSGDCLFRRSIGRSDLPGGDHALLMASIERELLPLPDDTRVLPGHGPETTIGEEALANPFLAGRS